MSFFVKPSKGRFGADPDYEPQTPTIAEPAELDDFTPKDPTPAQSGGFGGVGLGGSSIELKVVKPDKYDDVASIADHLMHRRTVVLNLESANKEIARRMIDFLTGVAYAIDGQIKRVAASTYIITPNNVDVSDGTVRAEEEPAVPTQSSAGDGDDYFADVEG